MVVSILKVRCTSTCTRISKKYMGKKLQRKLFEHSVNFVSLTYMEIYGWRWIFYLNSFFQFKNLQSHLNQLLATVLFFLFSIFLRNEMSAWIFNVIDLLNMHALIEKAGKSAIRKKTANRICFKLKTNSIQPFITFISCAYTHK